MRVVSLPGRYTCVERFNAFGISPYGFPNPMIGHSMSAISDVPHGAGLSVIMPAWMQWYQSQRPAQFKRFAKEIFGLDKAEEAFQALKPWFDKIGTHEP